MDPGIQETSDATPGWIEVCNFAKVAVGEIQIHVRLEFPEAAQLET